MPVGHPVSTGAAYRSPHLSEKPDKEGGRVELPRPLSGPVPFRAGWACRVPEPSERMPAAGIEPAFPPCHGGGLPLTYAGARSRAPRTRTARLRHPKPAGRCLPLGPLSERLALSEAPKGPSRRACHERAMFGALRLEHRESNGRGRIRTRKARRPGGLQPLELLVPDLLSAPGNAWPTASAGSTRDNSEVRGRRGGGRSTPSRAPGGGCRRRYGSCRGSRGRGRPSRRRSRPRASAARGARDGVAWSRRRGRTVRIASFLPRARRGSFRVPTVGSRTSGSGRRVPGSGRWTHPDSNRDLRRARSADYRCPMGPGDAASRN